MKIGEKINEINMDIIREFISESTDFLKFDCISNTIDLECRNCYHNKIFGQHQFYKNNPKIKYPYILSPRDGESSSLMCYEEFYLGDHPTHAMNGYKEFLTEDNIKEIKLLVCIHNKKIFDYEYKCEDFN